jgi:hypothetical protein
MLKWRRDFRFAKDDMRNLKWLNAFADPNGPEEALGSRSGR